MKKRIVWFTSFFILVIVLTFVFYGVKWYMTRWYMTHFTEPPVSVSTTVAKTESWHPFLTAVGSLKASNGVEVNAEVSGQIRAIYFKSGDFVKAGDLLVQLDDDVDKQTLASDEAQLVLNKVDLARKEKLLQDRAVSKSTVDSAQAAYSQSVAAVASDNVMLSKKKIRAPFSGKIGIRQVDLGQYLSAGDGIVTLQALNPLFVDFSIPEQQLSKLHNGQPVELTVDAYPTKIFKGKIIALNSKVEVSTRSIDVRAEIPNQDQMLYPGMFTTVKVILPEKKSVLTIPQTAVTYSLYGDSVYLIEPQQKNDKDAKADKSNLMAVQKFIKIGERRSNVVSVTEGIKSGDTVVTAGQVKLHPDAAVVINNSVQLK